MSCKLHCNSYDVAVVGSGPAGSSAAYSLAKHGAKTLVLEKHALPRHKTCGGGLVYRAIQKIPKNIDISIEREFYASEMNLLDINKKYSTSRDRPIITMTMRNNFDFSLLSASLNEGAELKQECEVLDLEIEKENIRLLTTVGDFSTKFVIAADGATSMVAKRMNWQDTRILVPALEYEVYVREDLFKRFSPVPRFDFGIGCKGYAWVFPKKDHLSIGMLSMNRGQTQLRQLLMKYMESIGIDRIDKLEPHGYLIPVTPRCFPFAHKRVFLTGDAAGFADPITAEGISFAIQSGQIAAQALLSGEFDATRSMEIYNLDIQQKILPELRAARKLATLLYEYPKLRTLIFRLYGQKLAEIMTDIYRGEKNYSDLFKNPLNYLKLITHIMYQSNKRM